MSVGSHASLRVHCFVVITFYNLPGSLGGGIALFALNFIIGGVIGGFVLVWRLIVAVWYVPLTVYRLIVG